jgi:hypothetical protein
LSEGRQYEVGFVEHQGVVVGAMLILCGGTEFEVGVSAEVK